MGDLQVRAFYIYWRRLTFVASCVFTSSVFVICDADSEIIYDNAKYGGGDARCTNI